MKDILVRSFLILSFICLSIPLFCSKDVNSHSSQNYRKSGKESSHDYSSYRPGKQIVGYYPNWQWFRRNHLVNPLTIDYSKYTVIDYAFFQPMSDGSIISTDSWADENVLLGPTIWWPEVTHDSTQSLPYLAAQAGVKVLPSIGGWSDLSPFPPIAADPIKRQTFAHDCINLIQTYHFNGIDIDWEYPGNTNTGGTLDDAQNFTYLLQDIRSALDSLEAQSGQEYILSACFGASQERMDNIQWSNILPLVDMVNLMAYDFHGSWDTLSNFNAPLYSPSVGDPGLCIDEAFTLLTQTYNVPPGKINIGVAFYGKSFANCTQLYGTHTGYDSATFSEDAGQPHYYSILDHMNSFTYHWDDQVKCPYLLGNSISTFVSYDNEESIGYKAQYIVDHNAMGAIIWEITGDYIETSPGSGTIAGTPLADTLLAVFNAPTGISDDGNDVPGYDIASLKSNYPNPFSHTASIDFTLKDTNKVNIEIFNIRGQRIATLTNETYTRGSHTVTWNGRNDKGKRQADGMYLCKMKAGNYSGTLRLIKILD